MTPSDYLGFNIDKTLVNEWLQLVKKLSGGFGDFEQAISIAKAMAMTEEETESLNTVASLYRAECSGRLNPPMSLKKMYKELKS